MWAHTTLQPAAQVYTGRAIVNPSRCIINSFQHSNLLRLSSCRHSIVCGKRTVHVQCHPKDQVASFLSYQPREPAAGRTYNDLDNRNPLSGVDSEQEVSINHGTKVWSDDLSRKEDNGINGNGCYKESKISGALLENTADNAHSNRLENKLSRNPEVGNRKTTHDTANESATSRESTQLLQSPTKPQTPPDSIPIPLIAVDVEQDQEAIITNNNLAQSSVKDMQPNEVAKEIAEGNLGVTIQVAYPSSINTSRERHWALLKELVPPDEWQDTAVVLACLESIYRAEYLQFGQAAMAVLQAANTIRTQPDVQETMSKSGPNGSSPLINLQAAVQAVAGGIDGNAIQTSRGAATHRPSIKGVAGADSNGNGLRHGQIGAEHEEQMNSELAALPMMFGNKSRDAAEDVETSETAGRKVETAEEAAERMDAELAGLLAFLSSRSQFQPLTVRDVEIARALNRDYLFQLFIVGDLHRMDSAWVEKLQEAGMYSAAHRSKSFEDFSSFLQLRGSNNNNKNNNHPITIKDAEEAAIAAAEALGLVQQSPINKEKESSSDSSEEADNESDMTDTSLLLAEECESLLLLKRNWGHEDVTGRLIVQKLDYLQTLGVATVLDSARNTISSAGAWVRGLFPRNDADKKDGSKQAGQTVLGKRQRAGNSWAQWLDDKGVWPRLHALNLRDIDTLLPLPQSKQLPPLTLRKVALAEVLGSQPFRQRLGSLLKILFQPVTLQQPTIKELVVAYRRLPDNQTTAAMLLARAQKVGQRLRLLPKKQQTRPAGPRPPIQIRVYRDIPLPTWQLTLPDKKLQFRPLDLLRADLFALTGLVALLAQAKYESLLLDIITFVSATVFLIRIALGFKRMDDRYRNQVAEVLREKTVASDGPALEYLAAAAALQQFKQASLAYVHGLRAEQHASKQPSPAASVQAATQWGRNDATAEKIKRLRKNDAQAQKGSNGAVVEDQQVVYKANHHNIDGSCITSEKLSEAMETLLWEQCGLKVMFDGEQAISELLRLGLAEECKRSIPAQRTMPIAGSMSTEQPTRIAQQQQQMYHVVSRDKALDILQRHWGQLLWQRAKSILREFE